MSAVPHSPVIVVSPALRAGTTLVQRLLSSAPNTLIHGDLVGQDVEEDAAPGGTTITLPPHREAA